MKKLRTCIKRFKWLLLIVAIVLSFLLFINWALIRFADILAAKSYVEYVQYFYLPEQRRKTGKWPSNLNRLPQENPAKNPVLTEVFITHDRLFESFEPVKSDRSSYRYILHLRNYDVTRTSRLVPKGASQEICDYQEK